MFCETDSIPHNIPHIQTKCEEYPRILSGIVSVPHNIIMDLNNVMKRGTKKLPFKYHEFLSQT